MRSAFKAIAISIALAVVAVAASNVQAAPEDDAIQKSIKRGVAFLKAVHAPAANYRGGSHGTGTAPLVGLALLEADVADTDPVLRNITAFVREHALQQTETYNISLTMLFLDRLGNPADRPAIQLLGYRLLAGQEGGGGWSYDCGNALTTGEEARLKKAFQNEAKLVAKQPRADLPVEKKDGQPVQPVVKKDDDKPVLHPEVAKWGKLINSGANEKFASTRGPSDNSNTQFAILGVWVARKHGVACDEAITACEKRFRNSQNANGTWDYTPRGFTPPMGSIPALTCSGLLALAIAHGQMESALKNKPDNQGGNKPKGFIDIGDDPAIKSALKALGNFITAAKGQQPEGVVMDAKRKRFKVDELNTHLYFLWSLERVAVLYGLDTVGNHDWYAWGSDALLDTQLPNGSWGMRNYHGANPEINTAFAILFLSRANIARDLSMALKGKLKDPGEAKLRGGNDVAKILPKKDEPKANVDPPKVEPKTNVEPKVEPKVEGPDRAAITKALVNASDADRAALLAKYRDEKGSAYTDALASAASRWTGSDQQAAREALANRLKRMTAATLRNLLIEEDREIRRAAAIACVSKEDKAVVADLIEALRDQENLVVQAARSSLKGLTSQDFGPREDAAAADKVKAVLAWRNWWMGQKK